MVESIRKQALYAFPDVVWLKDDQGVFLSCNRAAERLFRVSRDRILGHICRDFLDDALATRVEKNDAIALQGSSTHISQEWIELGDEGPRRLLEVRRTELRSE